MQSAEQAPGFGGDEQGGQDGQEGDQAGDEAAGGDEQPQQGQPGQPAPQADPGADPGDDGSPGKPFGKSWHLVKATEGGGNPLHDPLGRFAYAHGERAGLKSMVVPLVRVHSTYAVNRKALQEAAIAKLRKWPKDGEVNDDTGFSLVVGRDDWYKMAKWDKQTIAGLQAIGGLESIVHKAIRAETHADKNGNPHVFAVHRLYCPVMIGAVFHRVKLTVKDYLLSDGVERKNLHSLDAVELEGPSEYHQRDPQGTLIAAPPGQAPGLGVSMSELLAGVKRDSDGLDFGSVLAKAIPAAMLQAKGDQPEEEPKPHPGSHGVGVNDEVFFHHPAHGATSGKVLAYGADGFTAEHASGRVGVPWDGLLGHKKRAERTLTQVESGEGGSLVKDEVTGRHHFLAGKPSEYDGEDPEFDEERSLILGDHKPSESKPEKPLAKSEPVIVNLPAAQDFTPVLLEIQKSFAEHTDKLSAALVAQSARIDAVADASLQSAEAMRSEQMTKAIVGAIAEDRKPMEISLKLEMPEQKTVSKTIRRNPDGSMTVVEG